jgi:hypothetical protein
MAMSVREAGTFRVLPHRLRHRSLELNGSIIESSNSNELVRRELANTTNTNTPSHTHTHTHTHFNMAANVLNTIYRFAIPLAAGVGLAQASLYDVKGGNRAIIFDRLSGVREGVVNEGTHFLIPWLQKAIIYDVRTKPRNISTTTGSKDLQMVSLTLRVLHRPEVSKLSTIYQVCHIS